MHVCGIEIGLLRCESLFQVFQTAFWYVECDVVVFVFVEERARNRVPIRCLFFGKTGRVRGIIFCGLI